MFFPTEIRIGDFCVYRFEFIKAETVYVPARTFHSLTLRTDGKISVTPDGGKKMISTKGSITYIPKGCGYSTEISEGGNMFALHFETASPCDTAPFVFSPTYPIVFANLFSALSDRYRDRGIDYGCFSIVYQIFSELSREIQQNQNKPVPTRILRAKEYIDRLYNDPSLSVCRLSEMSRVSEVYFRREFKACLGVTPSTYIKNVRIENAKALLSTAMYSVGEVATRCGFDSISYFSSEFKRIVGSCPVDFQKSFEL